MHYTINIDETSRNHLKDKSTLFNQEARDFDTLDEMKDFLIERYGKMPRGKRKVYIDENGKTITIGFLHSFWNRDWSHNTKHWFQTDWITFAKVGGTQFLPSFD